MFEQHQLNQHQPPPVVAICTSCEYRWRTHESDLGTRIACLKCGQPAVVRRATEEELVDVPNLAPNDGSQQGSRVSVVPVGMEDYPTQAVRDKPPTWTFFSGVFTFPFYPSVFVRWVGISMFAVLFGHLAMRVIGGGGTPFMAVITSFSMFGGAVVLFVVGPYAAACFLSVLRDTAAGCNKVYNWPGPDFSEWFLTPRFFLMMFSAAAAIGYGLQLVIGTESIWPISITVFVLFPIFLLSSLEADSALIPITKPVFRSLFVLAGPWMVVYLESGGIIVLLAMLFDWANKYQAPVELAITITATVGGVIVYARILGRLAWRASINEASAEDEFDISY